MTLDLLHKAGGNSTLAGSAVTHGTDTQQACGHKSGPDVPGNRHKSENTAAAGLITADGVDWRASCLGSSRSVKDGSISVDASLRPPAGNRACIWTARDGQICAPLDSEWTDAQRLVPAMVRYIDAIGLERTKDATSTQED